MKLNWGTGLILVMLLFIGFILFFVYQMTTDHKLEHDLVTDGYYQKEMELQETIDAQKNSADMEEKVSAYTRAAGYLIQFPESFEPSKIHGTVYLYRPSDKRLDFEMTLKLSDSYFLIPKDALIDGRWNITIDWEYEGKKYRFEKKLTY